MTSRSSMKGSTVLRFASAFLLATCVTTTACAPTDEPDPGEAETAVEPGEDEEAVLASPYDFPQDPDSAIDPTGFVHGPHRAVECNTCHQSIAQHSSHNDTPCTSCHAVPVSFATLRTPTELDCMTCHHVEHQEYACTRCHATREITGERPVTAEFATSVVAQPVHRDLAFDHAWHGEQECQSCHSRTAYAPVEQECASCHEDHHRADANCAQCHSDISRDAHPAGTVHAGCGSTGCHVDAVVTALPPSRTLCLSCHQDQLQHETDGDCAVCHRMAQVWRNGGDGIE